MTLHLEMLCLVCCDVIDSVVQKYHLSAVVDQRIASVVHALFPSDGQRPPSVTATVIQPTNNSVHQCIATDSQKVITYQVILMQIFIYKYFLPHDAAMLVWFRES